MGYWSKRSHRNVISEIIDFDSASLAAMRAYHEDSLQRDARCHIRTDVSSRVPAECLFLTSIFDVLEGSALLASLRYKL